jgi:hypothetical protein
MFIRANYKKSIIAASLVLALSGCNDDDKENVIVNEEEAVNEEVVNVVPVAQAGEDATVDENTQVTLSGSGIDDDGTIASYSWVQTEGVAVTLTNADQASAEFTAPDVKPSETLTFELTVTDDAGATATDSVSVTVTHINASPTISIPAQEVEEKEAHSIDAVAEDDGEIASYLWVQTGGTEVELSGATTVTLSFIAPSVDSDETLTFVLTVEDDEGETTTETVNVNVLQKNVELTLVGLVTDSPIIDANVVINVGDEQQVVTAGSDGSYSATLSVDDDATDKMVSIVASGVGSQTQAKLMSVLGSVEALNEASTGDGEVTKDDFFGVNVTNVTTANAGLMQRENLGAPIVDDETLAALNLRVSQQEKFALATAIKVAIDKAGDDASLALPDGIVDTLALAQNPEASTAYIETIEDTEVYASAYEEIIADPELVDSDLDSSVTTYFLLDYYNPLISYPGKKLTLTSDTTATYSNYLGTFEAERFSDNSEITLEFDEGVYRFSQSEFVDVNGVIQEVEVGYDYHEITFLPLSEQDGVVTFEVTSLYSKYYPNGELEDIHNIIDDPSQVTAITLNNATEITIDSADNKALSLPVTSSFFEPDNNNLFTFNWSSDTFEFNEDGTGNTRVVDNDFTWVKQPYGLKPDINELVITFDDGTTLTYVQLTDSSDNNLYAVSGISLDGQRDSYKVDAGGAVTDEDKFDVASVPGIYTYAFDGDSLNEFWWELWPNGKAYTIEVGDYNGDGKITTEEILVMYGNWSVEANGELQINRYRFTDYSWPGCFNESADCYLYNSRTWSVFAQVGDAYHITNLHKFDFNQQDGSSGFDGIVDYFTQDNRRVSKQANRPVTVTLPEHPHLPALPPQAFVNLVAPSGYIGTTIYGVEQNGLYTVDDASITLSLEADETYTRTFEALSQGSESGSYLVAADNSILLKAGDVTAPNALQAFLLSSDDVLIGAHLGAPVPFFETQQQADDYETVLREGTSVASFDSLKDKSLVLVDASQNGDWSATYLQFDGTNVVIYTDSTYSEVDDSFGYSLNDDGSIDVGGRVYLSLSTTGFSVFVSDEGEGDYIDFNYLFEDTTIAAQFVENANNLRATAEQLGDN